MDITDIINIKSIDDLKALGSVEYVGSYLKKIITPLKFSVQNYDELLSIIELLKQNWVIFAPVPFVSEIEKYKFILTHLEGEKRNTELGITDEHYQDPQIAKNWYRKIAKLVHADNPANETDEAFLLLKSLYEVMIDDENFGDEDE